MECFDEKTLESTSIYFDLTLSSLTKAFNHPGDSASDVELGYLIKGTTKLDLDTVFMANMREGCKLSDENLISKRKEAYLKFTNDFLVDFLKRAILALLNKDDDFLEKISHD
jgi:hypothetical protein